MIDTFHARFSFECFDYADLQRTHSYVSIHYTCICICIVDSITPKRKFKFIDLKGARWWHEVYANSIWVVYTFTERFHIEKDTRRFPIHDWYMYTISIRIVKNHRHVSISFHFLSTNIHTYVSLSLSLSVYVMFFFHHQQIPKLNQCDILWHASKQKKERLTRKYGWLKSLFSTSTEEKSVEKTPLIFGQWKSMKINTRYPEDEEKYHMKPHAVFILHMENIKNTKFS